MSVEGEIIQKRKAMTEAELLFQISQWEERVAHARGFPSAKEAATQLKLYVNEANSRGLKVENKYPIKRG